MQFNTKISGMKNQYTMKTENNSNNCDEIQSKKYNDIHKLKSKFSLSKYDIK